MKSLLFILPLIITVEHSRAEDVRLSNGTVLRNVTVERSDDRGVNIRPNTFAASATKYPWNWIHPEDAVKLKERGAAQNAQAARIAEVEKTAINARLKIKQVLEDGALVQIVAIHREGYGFAYQPVEDDRTLCIVGKSTKTLVDGGTLEGKIYPVGRYQYESVDGAVRTVPRYATTPEHAIALLDGSK